MADLYQTLGVDRKVSEADLKKAYRKLAKKYHPDLNPNDEKVKKKFQELTAAYDILSDPAKRAKYDNGEIDEQGNPKAPEGFYQGFRSSGSSHPFQDDFQFGGADFSAEDLFSSIFGQGRGRSRPQQQQRGQDIAYTLKITFLEAVKGGTRQIVVGNGKAVDLKIPAGTVPGSKLRLKGKGHEGKHGGATGDAYVEIHVADHPYFIREDLDIRLTLPISLPEAVLGGKVSVPTIHGSVQLTLPPHSDSGKTLRLKGKGIEMGGKKGDQYVTLQIKLPPKDDAELKDFMEKYQKSHPYFPHHSL